MSFERWEQYLKTETERLKKKSLPGDKPERGDKRNEQVLQPRRKSRKN